MKLLKVISMILLICKAGIGLCIPVTFGSGQSCCSELNTEMSADRDCKGSEEEKKGCCDTSVCDCLCCGHIFTLTKSFQIEATQVKVPVSSDFVFSFNYTSKIAKGIWQPPRMS